MTHILTVSPPTTTQVEPGPWDRGGAGRGAGRRCHLPPQAATQAPGTQTPQALASRRLQGGALSLVGDPGEPAPGSGAQLPQLALSPSIREGKRDGAKWFSFKFIEGMSGGSNEGRQRAGPSWFPPPAPGPRMGGGQRPTLPGPLTPHETSDGPGLWNGTAAPHTHTQAHSVTTTLKLRGGREERRGEKKKIRLFQCLLLRTPGTQVGACALGGAVWH